MSFTSDELKVIESLLHYEELKLLSTIESLENEGVTPTRLIDKHLVLANLLLKVRRLKVKLIYKSPCN